MLNWAAQVHNLNLDPHMSGDCYEAFLHSGQMLASSAGTGVSPAAS